MFLHRYSILYKIASYTAKHNEGMMEVSEIDPKMLLVNSRIEEFHNLYEELAREIVAIQNEARKKTESEGDEGDEFRISKEDMESLIKPAINFFFMAAEVIELYSYSVGFTKYFREIYEHVDFQSNETVLKKMFSDLRKCHKENKKLEL